MGAAGALAVGTDLSGFGCGTGVVDEVENSVFKVDLGDDVVKAEWTAGSDTANAADVEEEFFVPTAAGAFVAVFVGGVDTGESVGSAEKVAGTVVLAVSVEVDGNDGVDVEGFRTGVLDNPIWKKKVEKKSVKPLTV